MTANTANVNRIADFTVIVYVAPVKKSYRCSQFCQPPIIIIYKQFIRSDGQTYALLNLFDKNMKKRTVYSYFKIMNKALMIFVMCHVKSCPKYLFNICWWLY